MKKLFLALLLTAAPALAGASPAPTPVVATASAHLAAGEQPEPWQQPTL